MYELRRALGSDIPWLQCELKKFSTFIETKYELYGSDEYTQDGLQLLIDKHFLLIAELQGTPVGFIAGYFTGHLFNPSIKVFNELFWWVPSGHPKAAYSLLKEFIKFGKENAQWIVMSLNRYTKINEKSLLRKGFHEHERNFLMEV
jgi:hypothetical protein